MAFGSLIFVDPLRHRASCLCERRKFGIFYELVATFEQYWIRSAARTS